MDRRISVLIVESSITLQAMLEAAMAHDDAIEVVGAASRADDALALIGRHRPDIVTLDIAMADDSGLALLDQVLRISNAYPVIITALVNARCQAMRRGARGFFEKARVTSEAAALNRLIRTVALGRIVASADDEAAIAA